MPGTITWALDAGASANEVSLTGTCQNGVKIRRRLWLDGAMLRTETVLENATAAPVTAAVQSQWDVNPGDLASVVLRYRKQAGDAVEKAFIEPEKMPSGSEVYNGGDQPDGEWRVVSRRGGPVWVSRFPKEQVGRCYLSWTAKSDNRVSMAVSSVSRSLRPGEQVRLAVDYGME
jgi:hypothetical protein